MIKNLTLSESLILKPRQPIYKNLDFHNHLSRFTLRYQKNLNFTQINYAQDSFFESKLEQEFCIIIKLFAFWNSLESKYYTNKFFIYLKCYQI